jgi:competence protein ComGC
VSDCAVSKYLTIGCLGHSFIGIPIFFLVKDQPDVQLFIFSGIILIICLSILLLLFVPKIKVMRKGEEGLPRNYRAGGSVWMAKSEVARDSRRGSSSEMRQDGHRASSIEMRQNSAWNQKSLPDVPETLISVPLDESDDLSDHPIDENVISVPLDENDDLSDHPIDENVNERGPTAPTICVPQDEKGDNE